MQAIEYKYKDEMLSFKPTINSGLDNNMREIFFGVSIGTIISKNKGGAFHTLICEKKDFVWLTYNRVTGIINTFKIANKSYNTIVDECNIINQEDVNMVTDKMLENIPTDKISAIPLSNGLIEIYIPRRLYNLDSEIHTLNWKKEYTTPDYKGAELIGFTYVSDKKLEEIYDCMYADDMFMKSLAEQVAEDSFADNP